MMHLCIWTLDWFGGECDVALRLEIWCPYDPYMLGISQTVKIWNLFVRFFEFRRPWTPSCSITTNKIFFHFDVFRSDRLSNTFSSSFFNRFNLHSFSSGPNDKPFHLIEQHHNWLHSLHCTNTTIHYTVKQDLQKRNQEPRTKNTIERRT